MIYPDIPLNEWRRKYPDLDILVRTCDHCGARMETSRPFISANYIGLTTPPCVCGRNRFGASSTITRTKSERDLWDNALGHL